MKRSTSLLLAAAVFAAVSCSQNMPQDGVHTLHLLSTSDVHGAWFDEDYVTPATKTSLLAVNTYVDSIRLAYGKDNVLLLDAGDCLQGDNAAYYFNYINPKASHLYPRMAKYMGYDAIVVGNHDIETGHPVYDRIRKQLKSYGIPFLAGNTPMENGKNYFQEYAVFKKAGLKVLVLGYTNANIKAWLGEELWKGMDFISLTETVQERVDAVTAKVKPDVVIVATHSGTGRGDGSILESQALDLFKSLRGVDVVIAAHDHRPYIAKTDSILVIDNGSRAGNLGHSTVSVTVEKGKVSAKTLDAEMIRIDKSKADPKMREAFREDFNIVKEFTMSPVGKLTEDMYFSDAVKGPSFYVNLLHRVQMDAADAQISFAAPLQLGKVLKAGDLIFNDMFSLYPYENALCCMQLYGREIEDYLEYSYDAWINYDGKHVLNIVNRPDPRYNTERWSFGGATYNYDSAGGINYTVDVTKHYGDRISITSLADGKPFEADSLYRVALTSYRASGGGDLILKGANLTREELPGRTVWETSKEIRELIMEFCQKNGCISPEAIGNVGTWQFVPSPKAQQMVDKDAALVLSR